METEGAWRSPSVFAPAAARRGSGTEGKAGLLMRQQEKNGEKTGDSQEKYQIYCIFS